MLIYLPCLAGEDEKMDVVELNGSYFEIGEKWGASFKDEVQASIEIEINGIARFFGIEKQAVVGMASKFLSKATEYDPDFIEVLKGFSKGSGLPFEDVFALRSLLEVMFFMQKIPSMCTSFAVTGEATKDSVTIIGQNIDWHPGLPMKVLRITWPNGVKQLSLSLGGIWEYPLSWHPSSVPYGLAANLTVALAKNQKVNNVPVSILMNKASRQKRMELALGEFINVKKDLASFLLANGEGDMIGVESALGDLDVLYPDKDKLVRSNHYLTDRFKPNEFFASFAPDTYLRYARIKTLVEKHHGGMTPQMMMTFMADHHNHPRGLCTHVDPESKFPPAATVASVIMVPRKRVMYIANGNPCESEYVKYTLE